MFKMLQRVTYQVPDLAKAKQWYGTVLGKDPALEMPFFVGFVIGDSMLGLVPGAGTSTQSDGRVIASWSVNDVDAAYRRLLDLGATVHTELRTVQQKRTGAVIDPFGNVIGITGSPGDPQKQSVEEQPSESAMGVTICRALGARDGRPGLRGRDNLAEIFLADDRKKILADQASREYIIQKMVTPELYGYILARTAYLDRVFEDSLAANIPQIVFLGAGYDSRSYRFREQIRDARIFELDVRTTQNHKRQMLARANVPIPPQLTFVTVNFKTESIADALSNAGFDKARETLFLWEGVTYYLAPEIVQSTLDCVRRNSPAGSTICFDYMTEKRPSVYAGEPFQFWIDREQLPAFLSERGYGLVDHLGPADIARQHLTLPDGSPAGKTLPYFSFARASVLE